MVIPIHGMHGFCESQIESLHWAAMEEDKITVAAVVKQGFEDHILQMYFVLALLCKVSALVTVKNTEDNNGLTAWRGLNTAYDSNNKGRQRVRMQYLSQPKRSESILQPTKQSRGGSATWRNTNTDSARLRTKTSRWVSHLRWHRRKCRTTGI